MSDLTADWYALVRASPRPESGEMVNVGLLFGNGEINKLVYEPGLPRLEGICVGRERHLYATFLDQLSKELQQFTDIASVARSIGPQLLLSEPRPLFAAHGLDVERALRKRYLAVIRTPIEERAERSVKLGRRIIDNVVNRSVRQDMQYIVKATAQQLYKHVEEWAPGLRVPRVGRAVRGPSRDLLLDAILLEANHLDGGIAAAARTNRAFWYYRKLREDIGRVEGREIRTTGVVIVNPGEDSPQVLSARDFILNTWGHNTDVVHSAVGAERVLDEDIAWAVGESDRPPTGRSRSR